MGSNINLIICTTILLLRLVEQMFSDFPHIAKPFNVSGNPKDVPHIHDTLLFVVKNGCNISAIVE